MNHRASATMLVFVAIALMATIAFMILQEGAFRLRYAHTRCETIARQCIMRSLESYGVAYAREHKDQMDRAVVIELQLEGMTGKGFIRFTPRSDMVEMAITYHTERGSCSSSTLLNFALY